MSNVGFKILSEGTEKFFGFKNRDWNVLTHESPFSNAARMFQRLVCIDAIELYFDGKPHAVQVSRDTAHFLRDLDAILDLYNNEKEMLDFDYHVEKRGSLDGPQKMLSCDYLGQRAIAWARQGSCTLELDSSNPNDQRCVGLIDLRAFGSFEIAEDFVIQVRKRRRDSQIERSIHEVKQFISDYVKSERFDLELTSHIR